MLKKGEEYKGFYVIDITDVKDYKCTGIYLRHKTTGLEVFHLLNDDEENLFSFCFRTPVSDSKGLPHVIEHSVLCGSEKFRLKEPYITLKSKSVSTFLNAMTYPDKTLYPGAALIEKQYFDIMDVYADSVFFPLLTENTFRQEAHRLELDGDGKLSVQGVVYNEMKGQFSNFYSCAYRNLISSLFPGTTYEYCSGGDPLEICNMTYKDFTDFHKKYYSPENCLLYLYGNIPTERQLDFIAEKYIPRLEKKFNLIEEKADYKVALPKVYDEVKAAEHFEPEKKTLEKRYFAPNGMEGNIVALSFYSGVAEMDQYLLYMLLCGDDSSPLKKRLKESKLADDTISMFHSTANQNFFIFGLVGVKAEDEAKAKKMILDSLQEIYEQGFSQDDIDAAVMSIDFNLREIRRNGGPFSIDILEKVMDGWNFGLHPAEKLTPITSFEEAKARLKTDKNMLAALMEKFFIGKDYVCTIIEPSEKFLNERNAKEEQFIAEKEKITDKAALQKSLDVLHEYQNSKDSPEAQDSIPHLSLADLAVKLPRKQAEIEKTKNNICLFTDKINTNGIIYFKIFFPFDLLKPEDYLDMPTFSDSLLELGWGGKNWAECMRESSKIAGDTNTSLVPCSFVETAKSLEFMQNYKSDNFFDRDWLGFEMKFLEEKLPEALNLMAEILNGLDFNDAERLETIITEAQINAKPSLVPSGLDFCSTRAAYNLKKEITVTELLFGITQLEHLLEYKPENMNALLKKFKRMFKAIKDSGCIINITADGDSLEETKKLLPDFIDKAALKPLAPKADYTKEDYIKHVYKPSKEKLDVIRTDTQVGFAMSVFECGEPLDKKTGAADLLLSWISEHTFWDKLRTVHGCYGAHGTIVNLSNIVSLSTYRDPDPLGSFDLFLECLKEAAKNKLSKKEIECAILSFYSQYTCPNAPNVHGAIALKRVVRGITQEQIDDYVKSIIAVTAEDLTDAAARLLEASKNEMRSMMCSKETETDGNIIDFD